MKIKSLFGRLSFSLIISLIIIVSSCDEQSFLEETPLSFYSPENSYITYENFEAAVSGLHSKYRSSFFVSESNYVFPHIAYSFTELAYLNGTIGPDWNLTAMLLPNAPIPLTLWKLAYKIIYQANVIICRSESQICQMTTDEKNLITAEARFFRGLMYKYLANMYGGVPIVLEEISEPKRDFVRSTREEVYNQCIKDLEYAVKYLPSIEEQDLSRINNLMANHLLAELYVTMERWDDAIQAASIVIDSPDTELVTERFGSMLNNEYGLGGDVYWDLFRKGNDQRKTGNHEGLWVMPFEYNVTGGYGDPHGRFIPRNWQIKVVNNDGKNVVMIPWPNDFYYCRGYGQCTPSHYFSVTLWKKSGEGDIRNSEYNIQRDFKVANPASDQNGKWLIKDNLSFTNQSFIDTMRNFYPAIAKLTTIGQCPKDFYNPDQTVPGSLLLTTQPSSSYKNRYMYRLAETYLLRAEAYLGKNILDKAAEDINIVRRRSNAPEITSADVNIDYILDERLRELYFEEFYIFTTNRLNKTIDRASKLNPYPGGPITYQAYNNLWPIPESEIEKNTEAVLEQNPGY